MEARALENEYVPQNIFDLHIQNIKERATSDRELFDERFEKLQAIMEKNLSEYKAIASEINGKIEVLNEKIENNKVYFDEKIEHVTDTLTVAINDTNTRIDDTNKRIDDMNASQNKWFMLFGILMTVVPIAVAIIQSFVGK